MIIRLCIVFGFLPAGMAMSQTPIETPSTSVPDYEFNDSHFHLTNYVQKGIKVKDFIEIMGDKTGRVAIFGIPLQQTWSFQNSGNFAPRYYTESDAPLYYYSMTDAYIAKVYESLPKEQRARFDPMITGFNPADMYAADHVERVLRMFPGVFTGIGEFSIHKEFVSSKVAGEKASLQNPALDRLFNFCAETGLLSIMHNDIDIPFNRPGIVEPVYLQATLDLLRRHPKTTIIWAHTGLGRIVRPFGSGAGPTERSPEHLRILEKILSDRDLQHVYFDISWDEVAKYIVATPESIAATAKLIDRFPDRFLYGSDEVAPANRAGYQTNYTMLTPLWDALSPETVQKVKRLNYERLFDAARLKVRDWEKKNVEGIE